MIITQIIPSFNVGGGELLAVRICAEIKRLHSAFSVHLISLYDAAPTIVYDEARASGAVIHTLGKRRGLDVKIPLKLNRVLREIKPDVIHTHLAGLRYTMGVGIFFRNALKVHTVHNIAKREASGVIQQLHSLAFKHFGWHPVALSPEIQKSILELYDIDAPIVNNGISVDAAIAKQQKTDLRSKLALPANADIIITIGRLCPQKNQILLIDSFEILSRRNDKETILLIVGEDPTSGSYRAELDEKLRALPEQHRKRIHLLGVRKDIPELLIASDVFVLSSDWEGLPLTLLEAMGYGRPSVCTSVGGIPDAVEDGVSGLLVPEGSSLQLAKAIDRVLNDKALAAKMSHAAQEKFQMHYSIERTAQTYLKLYKRNLRYV